MSSSGSASESESHGTNNDQQQTPTRKESQNHLRPLKKQLKRQLRCLKRRSRILLNIAAQELAHLEANNVLSNLKTGTHIRVCFRVACPARKRLQERRLEWFAGTVQRVHKRRVHVGASPSDSHVLVDVDFEDGDNRKCFPLQLDLQGDSHDADARWVIVQ